MSLAHASPDARVQTQDFELYGSLGVNQPCLVIKHVYCLGLAAAVFDASSRPLEPGDFSLYENPAALPVSK